jgi:enolase-phosphatase E1
MKIAAIVSDIEGTTTSIDFVHSILFPYSIQALVPFLETQWERPEVKKIVEDVSTIQGLTEPTLSEISTILVSWIKNDKKITPLKALQGLIWEDGYNKGLLRGHLYDDAARGLMRWHEAGIKLYVYSSGSVRAQKLLFGCSEFGDLTPLFSGYFDTTIGGKKESSSYDAIAEKISLPSGSILFLSDVAEELVAANEVGFKTIQLARDPSVSLCTLSPVVKSFDEIHLQSC